MCTGDVDLKIHTANFWDREDETCSSYSQMPLKLETVFSSKVSSSLVKENILKCWFKQSDSGSKGTLHVRITQGNRGNEPYKFFVKQFSNTPNLFLGSASAEGLNFTVFLQAFCRDTFIFGTNPENNPGFIWKPNLKSSFLVSFWTERSLKGQSWRVPKSLDTAGVQSVPASFSTGFDFILEFHLAQVYF